MQHHDAITGTHLEPVGFDYKQIMYQGAQKSRNGLAKLLKQLVYEQLGLQIKVLIQCDFYDSNTGKTSLCS